MTFILDRIERPAVELKLFRCSLYIVAIVFSKSCDVIRPIKNTSVDDNSRELLGVNLAFGNAIIGARGCSSKRDNLQKQKQRNIISTDDTGVGLHWWAPRVKSTTVIVARRRCE